MQRNLASTPPDSEWVEIGKAAGTGIGGVLIGFIGSIIRSRKSASRRIKHIEQQIDVIQADRAVKYGEFQEHRSNMNDAIAGLRDSLERVDQKIDTTADKLGDKLDTAAENVAYIRGLIERNGKSHG